MDGHYSNGYDPRRGGPPGNGGGPPRGRDGGYGHNPNNGYPSQHARLRSRSRDDGSRYNGGGGGRGGGRGGRGGGRGEREPRPSHMAVKTNYFRLRFKCNADMEWIQYDIEIRDAVRQRQVAADGQFLKEADGRFVLKTIPKLRRFKDEGGKEEEHSKTVNLERGSTPLSRRILAKLQQQLQTETPPRYFVSDGNKAAYAPVRLFTKAESHTESYPSAAPRKSTAGYYGPADLGEHHRPQAPQTGPFMDFEVRVKKECDENDEDADRVKNAWFLVRLREVGTIKFRVVDNAVQPLVGEQLERHMITQCIETMLKSQMLSSMVSCGKSPRMFYFPEDEQTPQLLGNKLNLAFLNKKVIPFVGISQSARFSMNGTTYICRDLGVSWFNSDKIRNPPQARGPIPILDPMEGTLAGVRIGDLSRPISPNLRAEVEQALAKTSFHVKFERVLSAEDLKFKRDKGFDEKKIQRARVVSHRNQRMQQHGKSPGLVWTADDPDGHSFLVKDRRHETPEGEEPKEVMHTVASYFAKRHGVQVRYPKMPIILTNYGYYPVEFLNQAFGKAKGANADDQKNAVLAFHDQFAANEKISHLTHAIHSMDEMQRRKGQDPSTLLSSFNVEIEAKPISLNAVVLKQPSISFFDERSTKTPKDGSWDLRDVKFKRPADLMSFAVVDFAGQFMECMTGLLEAMRRHGIAIPEYMTRDTVGEFLYVDGSRRALTPECIAEKIDEAVGRSTDFFLFDKSGFFRNKCMLFRSLAVNGLGNTSECLVQPLQDGTTLGVLLPFQISPPTHVLTNAETGEEVVARMMIHVIDNGGNESRVDPFDFRWTPSGHQVRLSPNQNGSEWISVRFLRHSYLLNNGVDVPAKAPKEVVPLVTVESWQIECPSVVFAYLPSKATEPYNVVKLMSNFVHGVQSQCIVKESFKAQPNHQQYFSNIALKLNTKLANSVNGARAWDIIEKDGIPWISQVPTLIMGISLSRGIGKQSKTIVAASVCLETNSCMQMAQGFKIQERSDVVEPRVMRSITKTLAIQFYKSTGKMPERVLVYRDGSSEGNFDALKSTEISSIRQAFYEINRELNRDHCAVCERDRKTGCFLCTPKITFIVCLNQHNVQVVPDQPRPGRSKNVFSGTCVDELVMPFQDGLSLSPDSVTNGGGESGLRLFETNGNGFSIDFLLTAQGGLKGTSRPVFYRTIWNENIRYKPNCAGDATPLTKEVLQQLTYDLSYMYGTATKAVRSVPVVHYSSRLANVAMGYMSYLTGRLLEQRADAPMQMVKVAVQDADPTEEKDEWIRIEMRENGDCDYAVKNELLPAFSPYENRFDSGVSAENWRTPFRPHLSS